MSVPTGLPSRRSIETPLLEPFIDLSSLLRASSLVYVSSLDLELETIRISNDSDEAVSMKGYRLCDANEFNWYEFPESFVLPGRRTVVVHCCPGKESSSPYVVHGAMGSRTGSSRSEAHNTPRVSPRRRDDSYERDGSPIHLQWTNKDGSLRRKNVLNDGACRVVCVTCAWHARLLYAH
jgi:hypothetical protein